MNYVCNKCRKKYDLESLAFRCECGGLFDLDEFYFKFSRDDILDNHWSLFRYLKALPFDENFHWWKDITMGEGLTPIIPLEKENPNLLVKVDYLMPTLSFKDRGAVIVVSIAKQLGVRKVIQDSSGNAGNSIAAYASRAGIECDIYVPQNTSSKKIRQISSHGANVHVVNGSREDTSNEALKAAEKGDAFYASHVYNPFFYQGTKTYAYEIFEQMNGNMPDEVVIPVGNGTLLLGCYYGFKELLERRLINNIPKFIAVQAQGCAPLHEAFINNKDTVEEVTNTGTLAEGIAIAKPMRGNQILEAIRSTRGEIITAPENDINNAREYLAKKGFYVEPTTAATFAAYWKYQKNNGSNLDKKVILPLCGAGLKSSS